MIQFKTKLKQSVYLGTFLAGLYGCSHGPVIQEFPETASATEETRRLGADLQVAVNGQIDVLSPKYYGEAKRAYEDAKEKQEKEKDPKDVLHRVAEGRAYLNQANQFASTGKANMSEVLDARREALAAGASTHFPKELASADEHLQDLTSEIEKNDLGNVDKKRGELQTEYISLEINSLKQSHLSQAKNTIKQAIDEEAEKFAPLTLADAQKQVKDTEAYIYGYRHDLDSIKTRSQNAQASAEHVLKITRDAKTAKQVSPEEIALRMEQERKAIISKQNELLEAKNNNQALEKQYSNLTGKLDLNQQFEEAQAEFSPEEAEVYKQGNKLLIRLKGLDFPVAQAMLKGSNFQLLAKVKDVIKKFGKSSVVVEGHTDADGEKKMNDKLSLDRALAVSDYLKSSLSAENTEISAVGYGYQRPLASNKTASGKAQNRRVDVVVTPTTAD